MGVRAVHRRLLLRTAAISAGLPAQIRASAARAQATGWRAKFPRGGFGILSVESQGATTIRFAGFPEFFQRSVGVAARIFQATDYTGVEQALTGEQIEMARLGGASYASAWFDSNRPGEPLAIGFQLLDRIGALRWGEAAFITLMIMARVAVIDALSGALRRSLISGLRRAAPRRSPSSTAAGSKRRNPGAMSACNVSSAVFSPMMTASTPRA